MEEYDLPGLPGHLSRTVKGDAQGMGLSDRWASTLATGVKKGGDLGKDKSSVLGTLTLNTQLNIHKEMLEGHFSLYRF